METLSVYSAELKQVITLEIACWPSIGNTAGYWFFEQNLVVLGYHRWQEWQSLYGDPKKQKIFLDKLPKVEQPKIG